jgi:hypothetical protein
LVKIHKFALGEEPPQEFAGIALPLPYCMEQRDSEYSLIMIHYYMM